MTAARQGGRHLHDVREIAQMLNARAFELARQIFPNGVRAGAEWTVADIGGAPGDNLSICIHGAKAGVWKQFNSADKGGDMLRLVQLAVCGGDMVEAIKWAKAWLGLDGADPAALRRTRQAVEQQRSVPGQREEAAAKRASAYRILQGARADIRGTLAEDYLRGRGLDIRRLLFPVIALRFHPELRASPRGAEQKLVYPAMVAPIWSLSGKFLGVHRTWLQQQPDGRVTKAPMDKPKKAIGVYNGGIIPLWRGLVEEAGTGEITEAPKLREVKRPVWIDLTEGIEDGVTVTLADPSLRVMVGVALASMANIRWPRQVEGVCIWQQNDPEFLPDGRPHPARAAIAKVVANYQAQGLRVKCAKVPGSVKDVNDYLRADAGDGLVSAERASV
jgi:hypothetical protein